MFIACRVMSVLMKNNVHLYEFKCGAYFTSAIHAASVNLIFVVFIWIFLQKYTPFKFKLSMIYSVLALHM